MDASRQLKVDARADSPKLNAKQPRAEPEGGREEPAVPLALLEAAVLYISSSARHFTSIYGRAVSVRLVGGRACTLSSVRPALVSWPLLIALISIGWRHAPLTPKLKWAKV